MSASDGPFLARFDAQAEGNVLEYGHVAEQRVVLEDEADIAIAGVQVRRFGAGKEDLALIGRFHTGDDAQQRGLAAARRTEERNEFAGRNVEVDVVERDEIAEALGDVADFDTHQVFSGAKTVFSMSVSFFIRHSTMVLATSVTRASKARMDAAAKAPMALYSL